MKWLDEEYIPIRNDAGEDYLMVLDQASFHRTRPILNKLKQNSTIPAIIPSRCTSLIQPLNTAVNKAFKGLLREATEELTQGANISFWTVSDRRILTTKAVAQAWGQLDPELVRKAFIKCGISINPNGSQDQLIKIKDLPNISQEGWDTQEDPIIKIKAIEGQEILQDGDKDKVFDANDESTIKRSHQECGVDYTSFNCTILKDMLRGRGLGTSGVKSKLILRLEEADSQQRLLQTGSS